MSHILNPLFYRDLVDNEIRADLGSGGDLTTEILFDPSQKSKAWLVSREPGIVAGLEAGLYAFSTLDPKSSFRKLVADGDRVTPGDALAEVETSLPALLTGERTCLNLLSHLSGIASRTAELVAEVEGTGCRILDTRKTLPGLRALQKYAVRCGGGFNHRYGLDGAVMLKDNHLAAAGGLAEAVALVRSRLGHATKIELEVDDLETLEKALDLPVDMVLLDNMPPETLRAAVSMVNGRFVTEASGGITLETVRAVAESGVDYISLGELTHSVRAMDIGLDMAPGGPAIPG